MGQSGDKTEESAPGGDALTDHINESLDDVIDLLTREIERLKVSLENYRLSEHPQRAEIIRWHVRSLDERQDALDELKALILATREDDPH